MNPYTKYILPRPIDLAMRSNPDAAERARFIPLASGIVLEGGAGSALNLSFYGAAVEKLYAFEPSPEPWRLGRKRVKSARFPVELLPTSADPIPPHSRCPAATASARVNIRPERGALASQSLRCSTEQKKLMRGQV